jgi:hypothetical protein
MEDSQLFALKVKAKYQRSLRHLDKNDVILHKISVLNPPKGLPPLGSRSMNNASSLFMTEKLNSVVNSPENQMIENTRNRISSIKFFRSKELAESKDIVKNTFLTGRSFKQLIINDI